MKKIYFTAIALVSGLCLSAQSTSPQVVSSAGNHFSNGSHQISFTIGEPVIATHSNSGTTLTQGFHQTKLSVISIGELVNETGISVYPNPVVQNLNIETTNLGTDAWINLYSTDGKLVLQKKMAGNEEKLNMESLAEGTYFLSLKSANAIIQTFSIIKTR